MVKTKHGIFRDMNAMNMDNTAELSSGTQQIRNSMNVPKKSITPKKSM